MSETKPSKTDVQKLQRAIVDGLEDVKGQDIVVFNTEHLSPLFERVIIASGTSNRQTKALAMSVSEAVREAGFPKPRVEGEDNGEWIIVDCGAAVAHVMQPNIRQYYHLEEIWGGKAVHLKRAAAKVPSARAGSGRAATSANEAGAAAKSATKPRAVSKRAAAASPAVGAMGSATVAKAPAKAASKAAKPAAKTTAKTASKAGTVTASPATAPRKTTARKSAVTGGVAAAPAAKVKTVVVGKPAAKKVAKAAGTAKPAARAPRARKPLA